MNSICLPTPLVLLLRRIFNVISSFSISQNYLSSRWITATASPEGGDAHDADHPDVSPESPEVPRRFVIQVGLSWDLLMRFRKAVPSRDREGVLHSVSECDVVTVPRVLHSEALTAKSPSSTSSGPIHHLISNPQLFDPVRAPRHPVVLCHGLYGFDVRGPEAFPKLRMHYWSNVLHILRKKVGAEVVVTGVPGTGSIALRAERMDRFLRERVKDREINFLAHSMGGLDCRHLITHIRPRDYHPLSLTSLSAPHSGSPFMDWCLANIGIGSPRPFPFPSHASSGSPVSPHRSSSPPRPSSTPLPYSLSSPLLRRPSHSSDSGSAALALSTLPTTFTAMILSLIDSPAYSNLTTSFLRDTFNPSTPDRPDVKYFSIAARTTKMSIWHPLWLPKLITDAAEEREVHSEQVDTTSRSPGHSSSSNATTSYRDPSMEQSAGREQGNDGLVTVSSAKWGHFLGTMEGCDHWELRGAGGLGTDWEEALGKMWRDWVGKRGDNDTERVNGLRAIFGGRNNRGSSSAREPGVEKGTTGDWVTKNELGSKFDLERFYVALSRKLYDEGL